MARTRIRQTHRRPERACLAGVEVRGKRSPWTLEESLDELGHLAEAAGAEVVARVQQFLRRPSRTYFGRGKLDEIKELVRRKRVDIVICDDEIAPAQQKTLEETLDIKVIDRSSLILDVFASRARTSEGKLQIELAQGEYLLPRLAGQWPHLERLGGGIGTRGPGEAQIETDRRLVRRRLSKLRSELERVRSHREAQRRNRARSDVRVVSLVGYTNAGKSAIFNRMTAADVVARDQLFSTLDPTTRKLHLESGVNAVLTDTVGFIHKLPATVVAAFQATLEELDVADLLVHVVDASHPLASRHEEVVARILDELGLTSIPTILVRNKLDLIAGSPDETPPAVSRPPASKVVATVATSASEGWGTERLRSVIDEALDLSESTTAPGLVAAV